jgi:hypothetical protein
MGPSSGDTTVFMRHEVLVFCTDDCLVCSAYETVIHTE